MAKAAVTGTIFLTGLVGVAALGALGVKPPDAVAGGSFEPGTNVGLDAAQLAQAARALTVADNLQARPLPVLSMVVSALQESMFRPVCNGKGSGYCGVFQADPNLIPQDDTEEQAKRFLVGGKGFQAGGAIRLARQHPSMSPGAIATAVEASGDPPSVYDKHRPQAERIIRAWRQGAIESTLPFGDSSATAIEAAAEQLDGMHIPYGFGDGHAMPAVPSPGLDCSSSVSWVFQHAGFRFPTMTSGMMMGWGSPGPGRLITIFASETHVFLKIGGRYFGTSAFGHPGAGTGPHFFDREPSAAYRAGFVMRHPAGL